MIFNNKKGYNVKVFGFFMILMILSGVLFFLTVGMHYILHDYGLSVAQDIANTTIGQYNPSNQNLQSINNLVDGYLGNVAYLDMLFAVIVISMFIQSIISAIAARANGFISFFGFVTLGNVFLIFLLNYAIQIRGWFLNEVVYQILLVNVSTPFMTTFFNYSFYIGVAWYLILIAVNQLDLQGIKNKFNQLFDRGRGGETQNEVSDVDFSGVEQK